MSYRWGVIPLAGLALEVLQEISKVRKVDEKLEKIGSHLVGLKQGVQVEMKEIHEASNKMMNELVKRNAELLHGMQREMQMAQKEIIEAQLAQVKQVSHQAKEQLTEEAEKKEIANPILGELLPQVVNQMEKVNVQDEKIASMQQKVDILNAQMVGAVKGLATEMKTIKQKEHQKKGTKTAQLPVEMGPPVVTQEQLDYLTENVRQSLVRAKEEITQIQGDVVDLKAPKVTKHRVPERTRSEEPRKSPPPVEKKGGEEELAFELEDPKKHGSKSMANPWSSMGGMWLPDDEGGVSQCHTPGRGRNVVCVR